MGVLGANILGLFGAGEAAAVALPAVEYGAGLTATGELGGAGALGGLASAGLPAGLTAAGTAFATEGLLTGGAAAGAAGGIGSSLLKGGAQAIGTGVASSLLQPKLPALPKPTLMPDPLAQEAARKKSIIEQTARRGRLSTILTEPAGDKLGG